MIISPPPEIWHNSKYLVLVGAEAKVLESLTGVLGATDQQGVAAGGGTQSQLVEGQGLATGGDDAAAGGSGESQSGDGHLGDLEKTVVIRDGADDDDGLVLLVADLALDAGQGNGGSVDLDKWFRQDTCYSRRRIRDIDLTRDIKRRRRTTLLKAESVRPVEHTHAISTLRIPESQHSGHLDFDSISRSQGTSYRNQITYGPGTCKASPRA